MQKKRLFSGRYDPFQISGEKEKCQIYAEEGKGGWWLGDKGQEGEGGAAEASPHFPGPRSKPEGAGTGFNHSLLFQKCLNGEMLTLWLLLPMACGAPDLADQAQFCSCISNYLQNMMVINTHKS